MLLYFQVVWFTGFPKNKMTFGEVIPELNRTVPEFKPDEAEASQASLTLVLNELVRFVFELDPLSNGGLVQRVFAFLDHLCGSADREVQMLARDVAWAIAE